MYCSFRSDYGIFYPWFLLWHFYPWFPDSVITPFFIVFPSPSDFSIFFPVWMIFAISAAFVLLFEWSYFWKTPPTSDSLGWFSSLLRTTLWRLLHSAFGLSSSQIFSWISMRVAIFYIIFVYANNCQWPNPHSLVSFCSSSHSSLQFNATADCVDVVHNHFLL